MANVKEVAMTRAIALLNASGARYHIEFEGREYGQSLAPPEPPRTRRTVKNVGISDYAASRMRTMQAGDCELIPLQNWPISALQSAVSGVGCQLWGNGGCLTSRKEDGVEVLRIT